MQDLNGNLEKIGMLERAKERFNAGIISIDLLAKEKDGSDVLVPITSQLYVHGKLKVKKIENSGSVVVDVATDYFIRKTFDGAKETLNRKIKKISIYIGKLLDQDTKFRQQASIIELVIQQKASIAQQQMQQKRA